MSDNQQENFVTDSPKITDKAATARKKEIDELNALTGTYILKQVRSRNGWLDIQDSKTIEAHVFAKAEQWISPELDKTTGLVKTGLTEAQARELENAMGLKLNDLSPYSKWWGVNFKKYPRVTKQGYELNLDRSAMDKLIYCFLKVQSKVALSESEALANPEKQYVLTSKDVEAKHESKKVEVKQKAYQRFGEMSLTEQQDFLKVYEEGRHRVTNSASPNFITATLGKIVDEKPEQFLELIEDPHFKTMVFMQECISIGALKKEGAKYRITGGDIVGHSFTDAILNLQKPEYSEVKVSLMAKLDALKKDKK